jgi:hypothetical protein
MIFDKMIECWDGSSRALFHAFLAANAGIKRWTISADYCLRDATRVNDCFAFSIIPLTSTFADLRDRIATTLPKDIKKARYLSQDGADLLMDRRMFHVVIVVPKDRDIFSNGPARNPVEISRDVARITLNRALEMERGENTLKPLRKMAKPPVQSALTINSTAISSS